MKMTAFSKLYSSLAFHPERHNVVTRARLTAMEAENMSPGMIFPVKFRGC